MKENKLVYAVIVFESGDCTTGCWGIYEHKEDALEYADSVKNNKELNSEGYYTLVNVEEHKLITKMHE